jgi:hypothetical protein
MPITKLINPLRHLVVILLFMSRQLTHVRSYILHSLQPLSWRYNKSNTDVDADVVIVVGLLVMALRSVLKNMELRRSSKSERSPTWAISFAKDVKNVSITKRPSLART